MMESLETKRSFLRKMMGFLLGLGAFHLEFGRKPLRANTWIGEGVKGSKNNPGRDSASNARIGTDAKGRSVVYLAQGGNADQNTAKILEMMGGIGAIIGPRDIVVIKPNAQWWNQGMTNTDSMRKFIECIVSKPDFVGEVIIADNNHFRPDGKKGRRGWDTENRNGAFNYDELINYFNREGFRNVTKYHWRDAGPNPTPLQGDDEGGRCVSGPADGDGYVWRGDIQYVSPEGRVCWMTYPVFTSKHSGITIDLKYGAWKDGRYLDNRPVRLINYSAINHHGRYAGVTASVKNLMGIVDMTCGFHGSEPKGTYNVHHIGVRRIIRYLSCLPKGRLRDLLTDFAYENFKYMGGALGKFITDIRAPDLNVITAEWIGWGSRTDVRRSIKTHAIAASHDPVALDYIAAREILMPATKVSTRDTFYLRMNNPDSQRNPFMDYLRECNRQGVGNLELDRIVVYIHRF